jgi:hypothetical protein
MTSRLSHLVSLSPETHSGFKRGDTALRQFQVHRAAAKERGIEFKMGFAEWEKWWQESGHYHERGRGQGRYVMARKGDLGAYELGNVECKLGSDNVREGNKTRKRKQSAQQPS